MLRLRSHVSRLFVHRCLSFLYPSALAAAIKKTDYFRDNVGKMSTCFFMLCPLSARGRARISDDDPDMEYVDNVPIEGTHFKPSIYKVTKRRRNQDPEVSQYNSSGNIPKINIENSSLLDLKIRMIDFMPAVLSIVVSVFVSKIEVRCEAFSF